MIRIVCLVFTTTSVDHALDGFKVRAMQYLVKPYEEAELTKLIDEILSHIPDFGKYIEIKVDGSNVRVPYAKIVYAEHFSHMMHIHTTNWQGINYATNHLSHLQFH